MCIMGDIITYPWANFDIGLAKPSMKQGQDEKFEQIVYIGAVTYAWPKLNADLVNP